MVPWYNEEIKLAKKERRRAERKWRITKTTADLNVFKSLKNQCTYLMRKAKCSFFSDFVEMNSDNQGKLFRAIKSLLKGKDKITFPRHDEVVLVNELGKHFAKKILDIHSEIENGTSLADNDDGGFQCTNEYDFLVFTGFATHFFCPLGKTTCISCSLCFFPLSLLPAFFQCWSCRQ